MKHQLILQKPHEFTRLILLKNTEDFRLSNLLGTHFPKTIFCLKKQHLKNFEVDLKFSSTAVIRIIFKMIKKCLYYTIIFYYFDKSERPTPASHVALFLLDNFQTNECEVSDFCL